MTMANLQKRPSIAPVPATLEGSPIDIHLDSDTESESEKEEDPPHWNGNGLEPE